MKQFDVITVGNAIIDLFLAIGDARGLCRINKETNELCIGYGEKIKVEESAVMIGGNATNAAVGLARAGFSVSLVAEIGDDEFAQRITKTLKQENIDTTHIVQTSHTASSMTVGLNFQKERTLFVEHVKRAHDFTLTDIETKWVYLTSLGSEWKAAYKKIIAFARDKKINVAFNPGTVQLQGGYEQIADVLEITDMLFLNREEAIRLINSKWSVVDKGEGEAVIKPLLIALQRLGPKNIVITDGKNGSFGLDSDGSIYKLGVFPASVVEKTGAGDAFASGFLAGVLRGKSMKEAMRWGSANASAVIEKIGAQTGLLHKKEMSERLEAIKEQANVL